MIINGLVKRKIVVFHKGQAVQREVSFFFGTLAFTLMKKEHGVDINEIEAKIELVMSNPLEGLEFIVDFLLICHRAYCIISNQEPQITAGDIWLALDQMGGQEIGEIFSEGLEKYQPDLDSDEKKTKPRTNKKTGTN